VGRGVGREGRRWGESKWEMEIPGIRMCDGDMYASYEGLYGVGGEYSRTVATRTSIARGTNCPVLQDLGGRAEASKYTRK